MAESKNIDALLADYIDGNLSESEMAEVDRLLQEDPALAEDLDGLDRTVELLRGMPEMEPPADMLDNILQKTTMAPTFLSRLAKWLIPSRNAPWAAVASGIAACMVLIVYVTSDLSLKDLAPQSEEVLYEAPATKTADTAKTAKSKSPAVAQPVAAKASKDLADKELPKKPESVATPKTEALGKKAESLSAADENRPAGSKPESAVAEGMLSDRFKKSATLSGPDEESATGIAILKGGVAEEEVADGAGDLDDAEYRGTAATGRSWGESGPALSMDHPREESSLPSDSLTAPGPALRSRNDRIAVEEDIERIAPPPPAPEFKNLDADSDEATKARALDMTTMKRATAPRRSRGAAGLEMSEKVSAEDEKGGDDKSLAMPLSPVQRFEAPYSGITQARNLLIFDAQKWASLWSQINKTRVPEPALPTVDFSSHFGVGVFIGQKNTGGFAVRITSVVYKNGTIEVRARIRHPEPGAIVTQALTQPYSVLVLPYPQGVKLSADTPVKFYFQ